MSQEQAVPKVNVYPAEAGWRSLYRAAGAGALVAVGFVLLDIVISFAGGDPGVGELSAVEWFRQLQDNWFVGLRNLGLFNVINPLLTLPLYLALYQLHRKRAPAGAALALILYLLGMAVYDASNRALAMLALSEQYAGAATEAQRSLLEIAGTMTLAQAEDFTPGSFLGLFFSSLASVWMMVVILQGRVFGRRIALTGLVGTVCLLFFTISATFLPAIYDLAMLVAMAGGLSIMAWNILMALRMFHLGRGVTKVESGAAARAQLDAASEGM